MSRHIFGDGIVVVETRRRWMDEERREALNATRTQPVCVVARQRGSNRSVLPAKQGGQDRTVTSVRWLSCSDHLAKIPTVSFPNVLENQFVPVEAVHFRRSTGKTLASGLGKRRVITNSPTIRHSRDQGVADMKRAYTIPQFCDRYGPKRTKTYQEIRKGRLVAVRCGRRTYIRHDDAEAWLDSLGKFNA